jgi:hypothetical protein
MRNVIVLGSFYKWITLFRYDNREIKKYYAINKFPRHECRRSVIVRWNPGLDLTQVEMIYQFQF